MSLWDKDGGHGAAAPAPAGAATPASANGHVATPVQEKGIGLSDNTGNAQEGTIARAI